MTRSDLRAKMKDYPPNEVLADSKGGVSLANKKKHFYLVKSNFNYVWDIYIDKYCPDSKILCRILQVREEGCPDVHIGGGGYRTFLANEAIQAILEIVHGKNYRNPKIFRP